MPVRDKAVDTALHGLLEGVPYHFINNPMNPIAVVDGIEMSRDEFDKRFMNTIEKIYERVVDSIDWNRAMIEAEQRHITLEGKDGHERCEKFAEDHRYGFGPQCLCEALLADETHVSWEHTPKSPRHHHSKEGRDAT